MNFDYKKYSLENLENWMHDAMSAGDASPQEIYDVIVGVVKENYYTYKHQASQAYELLSLLNSGVDNNKYQDYLNKSLSCDKDDSSEECQKSWNDFWEENYYPEENSQYTEEELDAMCDKAASDQEQQKSNSWKLPIDENGVITFPEDLLKQTGWKEGDNLCWLVKDDGSFELRKETPQTYQELVDAGWTMTADGFWIKEN